MRKRNRVKFCFIFVVNIHMILLESVGVPQSRTGTYLYENEWFKLEMDAPPEEP